MAEGVNRARAALLAVHDHPVNRRGWRATAAEASLRAARASAALDGAALEPDTRAVTDPVLAGAMRAADQIAAQKYAMDYWRYAQQQQGFHPQQQQPPSPPQFPPQQPPPPPQM